MKILVTGFEPWHDEINPSWEVVRGLPDEICGASVHKALLRVVAKDAEEVLTRLIDELRPDAIISLGQSGRRQAVEFERIAVNVDDYRIEDGDGNIVSDRPIKEGWEDGILTTLPIRDMAKACEQAGVPADISYTAGTHLCNHVMYFVLGYCRRNNIDALCGFIHVPLDISQCVGRQNRSFMDIELARRGVVAALEVVANKLNDGGKYGTCAR